MQRTWYHYNIKLKINNPTDSIGRVWIVDKVVYSDGSWGSKRPVIQVSRECRGFVVFAEITNTGRGKDHPKFYRRIPKPDEGDKYEKSLTQKVAPHRRPATGWVNCSYLWGRPLPTAGDDFLCTFSAAFMKKVHRKIKKFYC